MFAKSSPPPKKMACVRPSLRLGLLILGLVASGVVFSDSGVLADEASEKVKMEGPGPEINRIAPARIIRVDQAGRLEITRPDKGDFNVVTVVSGFGCEPGDPLCTSLLKGEYGEVAERFRQLAAGGMDDAWVLRGLGNALFLEGDLHGAMRAFAWAATDHPTDRDVRAGLAAVMTEVGVPDQAIEEYRDLLTEPGFEAGVMNNLGNAYRRAGRLPEAMDEYGRAAKADTALIGPRYNSGIGLMELDQHRQAALAFRGVSRSLPELSDAYLYEGLALLRSGQAVRAVVALHRADDLNSENPSLDLALGLASQEAGLDSVAIERLEKVLKTSTDDERVFHLLATSLVRTGQYARAARVLEQAFALDKRDADDHFQLGLKLYLCEQPQSAVEHLIQAMSMGKRDAEVFLAFGRAMLQAGDAETAVKSLFVASRMSPEAANIRYSLGLALQQADQGINALKELEVAAVLDPSDVDIKKLLMKAQLRIGKFGDCALVGRKVINDHPEMVGPRFDVAFCLALDGQLDRAAESIEDALDHDIDGDMVHPIWRRVNFMVETRSDVPGAYLLLGMIHERRGNWSAAIEAYEGLILASGGKKWASKALARIHSLAPESLPSAAR